MSGPVLFFDSEVYSNYTLFMFKRITGEVFYFEHPLNLDLLRETVHTHRLITFNGLGYDLIILMVAFKGASALEMKRVSDRIILNNLKWWNAERELNISVNQDGLDHIDLLPVALLTGSLKLYSARMHSRSIQDLPVAPSATLTEEQKQIIRDYCANDLNCLQDLYNTLKIQLELRESMSTTYGIDLRSKSDAQIAEAVIKSEVEKRTGHRLEKPGQGPGDKFQYRIPEWMKFERLDILDTIKNAYFVVSDKGSVLMPKELADKKIEIGAGVYRMGIGGLHSSETSRAVLADEEHRIFDFDVASYYPSILLNQGLYPKHIGPEFLNVYRSLVEKRLEAKKAGRKTENESLKICINGTFGKLGSKYSVLYSPDLMIQITVTGQLALLMLIEMLDRDGIHVVSANTDGVTVRCRRGKVDWMKGIVTQWEERTGFTTEAVEYDGLWSRDVNNYLALKTDGEIKVKGAYGTGLPLQKNPTAAICAKAAIDYLTLDASICGSIRACGGVRQFLSVRTVKGGATYHGREIGRVVRWYYSTEEKEALLYKVNGYLVPKTLGAVPLMVLSDEIPKDLDYGWYEQEARSMVQEVGWTI